MQTPTNHPTAVGPQEAPTAAQGQTSRVHRPQGGGGRTPRDHRRSGRDSTELRPQTWVFGPGGGRGGGAGKGDATRRKGAVGLQTRFEVQRRSPHRMRRPHARKKGTAKKLRACDKTAHQQYRKAGLQARFVGATSVSRPRWSGAAPRRSPSHLVASTDAGASSEKPICDLAARQKRRSPLAGRWPAASQRDRNRSYRILLGLDKLRVGLKGLFLDFNCS